MADGAVITLEDIWPIENPKDYKIHFGRRNTVAQPLDEWVRDQSLWVGWQESRPKYDAFNRTKSTLAGLSPKPSTVNL